MKLLSRVSLLFFALILTGICGYNTIADDNFNDSTMDSSYSAFRGATTPLGDNGEWYFLNYSSSIGHLYRISTGADSELHIFQSGSNQTHIKTDGEIWVGRIYDSSNWLRLWKDEVAYISAYPLRINYHDDSGDVQMGKDTKATDLTVYGGIATETASADKNGNIKSYFLKFKKFNGKLRGNFEEIKTGLKGIAEISLNLSYLKNGKIRHGKINAYDPVLIEFDDAGTIYIDANKTRQFENASYSMLVFYGESKIKKVEDPSNEEE